MIGEELVVVEPLEELVKVHHSLSFRDPLVIEGFENPEVPIVKDLKKDFLWPETLFLLHN